MEGLIIKAPLCLKSCADTSTYILSFKTFRIIVDMLFERFPMSDWVNQGFYEIVDESGRETTLGLKNWEGVIQPNMVLSMNMLLRKEKGQGPLRADCPSCGELYREYFKCKDLDRVRW